MGGNGDGWEWRREEETYCTLRVDDFFIVDE